MYIEVSGGDGQYLVDANGSNHVSTADAVGILIDGLKTAVDILQHEENVRYVRLGFMRVARTYGVPPDDAISDVLNANFPLIYNLYNSTNAAKLAITVLQELKYDMEYNRNG